MARETKVISELTAADVGKDIGYTAEFLVNKAGFTASGPLEEVRHQKKQTILVIYQASIIIPADYRDREVVIFDPAFRG